MLRERRGFMSDTYLRKMAPDFTLPTVGGSTVTLSQFIGKKVVLYFYPKDNTPGCSRQAQQFAESYTNFIDENTVILGVSRDSIQSHEKFTAKLGLPFLLLSDSDESVCKMYDVIKEKNMYGKKVMGIERSTFLINQTGEIVFVFRKVKVDRHAEKVLEALKSF